MTDQQAYQLIEENLSRIRSTYNWGKISIEIKDGKVTRINLTVPLRPDPPADPR